MFLCMLGHFSCVRLLATLWTAARQVPLSMRFSSQEYWSGLPYLPSRDLPDPGIKPASPATSALQADSLSPANIYRKPPYTFIYCKYIITSHNTKKYCDFNNIIMQTLKLIFRFHAMEKSL